MRPKLSIPAQIKDMKEAGIKFDIMSETDATRYLDTNTYYFRIKAYAKNYEKYIDTEKQGQYINLDFAYLVDLSEIDALLRELVLRMTSILEHYLKVKLLSDFQMVDEDGYEIVQELFKMQPELKCKIEEEKINTSTSNDLILKYKDDWAIWNLVEVLSFGSFSELYSLFYNRNNFKNSFVHMLHPIRMIRNASAHGNCLINRLRPPYSRVTAPNYDVKTELMHEINLSRKAVENKLANPVIHDFSVLLYLYSRIVPESTQNSVLNDLSNLFSTRILLNKDYYVKNAALVSCYDFMKNIVDFYAI